MESQEIVKAVHYDNSDFLLQPNIKNPERLIYNNIFPFRKIPTEKDMETQKTYITISLGRFNLAKSTKTGIVRFNVFSHQDLLRTDHGFVRTDFIIGKIDELVNSTRGLGIGKVEFDSMDELYVNNDYLGMHIAYRLYEWN